MKTPLVVGAFLAAVLIASPVLAKQGDPIPGVPIGLEGEPGGVVVSQTKTNSAGVAVFPNVKPGKYRITIGTIDWGDGSPKRMPISDQSAGGNRSRMPISDQAAGGILTKTTVLSAGIEVNVPGQAKVTQTLSQAESTKSVRAHDVGAGSLKVPFTVEGAKLQTVTITIYDQGASGGLSK
jgi:hypothetical protein